MWLMSSLCMFDCNPRIEPVVTATRIVAAIETAYLGSGSIERVTFAEEGAVAAESNLTAVEQSFAGRPPFGGTAIHDYTGYSALVAEAALAGDSASRASGGTSAASERGLFVWSDAVVRSTAAQATFLAFVRARGVATVYLAAWHLIEDPEVHTELIYFLNLMAENEVTVDLLYGGYNGGGGAGRHNWAEQAHHAHALSACNAAVQFVNSLTLCPIGAPSPAPSTPTPAPTPAPTPSPTTAPVPAQSGDALRPETIFVDNLVSDPSFEGDMPSRSHLLNSPAIGWSVLPGGGAGIEVTTDAAEVRSGLSAAKVSNPGQSGAAQIIAFDASEGEWPTEVRVRGCSRAVDVTGCGAGSSGCSEYAITTETTLVDNSASAVFQAARFDPSSPGYHCRDIVVSQPSGIRQIRLRAVLEGPTPTPSAPTMARLCGGTGNHVDCWAGGDTGAYCVFSHHCACSGKFVCTVPSANQAGSNNECAPGGICVVNSWVAVFDDFDATVTAPWCWGGLPYCHGVRTYWGPDQP